MEPTTRINNRAKRVANIEKRIYTASGSMFILIGFVLLLIKDDIMEMAPFSSITTRFYLLTASLVLIISGFTLFVMLYAKGYLFPSDEDKENLFVIDENARIERIVNEKLSSFKPVDISRPGLKDSIDKQVISIYEENAAEAIPEKVKQRLLEQTKLSLIDVEFVTIKARLSTETARLTRYSVVNLGVGFFTTFIAIFFLGYSLLGVQTTNTDLTGYLFHFIPRLSLSILVEVFSYFFLKLYKSNLEDIKYFNNERTNVDMKIIAIKTAYIYDDLEMLKLTVEELIKTERNFILKKEESTVEIEKNRLNKEYDSNIIASFFKILEMKK